MGVLNIDFASLNFISKPFKGRISKWELTLQQFNIENKEVFGIPSFTQTIQF